MNPTPAKSAKPVKSRLGLKLAALFTASFLVVFIGLFFWDLIKTLGERALVDMSVSKQPAETAIDPKLESELTKVLEYTDSQNTADIKNPFADQGGIGNNVNTPVTSSAPTSAVSAKTVNTPARSNNSQPTQARQTVGVNTFQPVKTPTPDPQAETKMRMRLREEKIRLGQDGGPESAVFAIDDLLPVGTVSGGDGKEEVMFFSESACRVVSFPIGAQFYDGWLDSLRPEGVVFGFYDQFRTMRMRSWGRSVNQNCSQSLQQSTVPEQAVMTEGGD